MSEPGEKKPVEVPTLHVLGPFNEWMQSCVRCKALLVDYRRMSWPADQEPPRGFPEGTEYVVGGRWPRFTVPRSEYAGVTVPCEAPKESTS